MLSYHQIGVLLGIALILPFGFGTLGSVYLEPTQPGEEASLFVNLHNFQHTSAYDDAPTGSYQGKTMQNLGITVWVPDLGIYERFTAINLRGDDRVARHLGVQVPVDAPYGDYLARVSVSNDHFKDTTYVWLSVT